MQAIRAVASVVLTACLVFSNASAALKLGSLFKDHMVVQREVDVPVWGWAAPGAKVRVELAGRKGKVKAGANGTWIAYLKPVAVGGPYTLTVIAQDTITVTDVLCGEVWICSGQSNMQMNVQESANPTEEIAQANWPLVRMFNAARVVARQPVDTCPGRWAPATPQRVAHFSAAAYYFGRQLHKTLSVPVGLIHTSWGGTPAESWTTEQSLKAHPDLAPIFEAVAKAKKESEAASSSYDENMAKWEAAVKVLKDETGKLPERQVDTGDKGLAQGWAKADADESEWKKVAVPGMWERTAGIDIDGAVWFRTAVQIPAQWAGRELKLSLGVIDDFDATYWNGTKIGSMGSETPNFWATPRLYLVQPQLVAAGTAVIAIRVFDHWGGGGFNSKPPEMFLMPTEPGTWAPLQLAGEWKYRVERELPPLMPPAGRMQFQPQNEPVVLYNAMINPFVPYAVKGAIWYQGESNAGRAWQYRTLLPTMIADWRKAWGQKQFAFGIVQLANFMERNSAPVQSEWAELREAQLATMQADKQAGLAVAIDIGDDKNIHPTNKQEVGRRLSLWAQAVVYGRDIVYSGPIYAGSQISGDSVVLRFTHTGSGLSMNGDSLSGFSIAGPDSQFVWANAVIRGETVVVYSEKVKQPLAVRYAWANNPECNLYNKEGLPASPFRTDSWPGLTDGNK